MHNKHEHIDPYFKKLQGHETPLPKDAWNRLNNHWFDKTVSSKLQFSHNSNKNHPLPPWSTTLSPGFDKTKKNANYKLFILLFLLFSLTTGVFWFVLGPTQKENNDPNLSTQKTAITSIKNPNTNTSDPIQFETNPISDTLGIENISNSGYSKDNKKQNMPEFSSVKITGFRGSKQLNANNQPPNKDMSQRSASNKLNKTQATIPFNESQNTNISLYTKGQKYRALVHFIPLKPFFYDAITGTLAAVNHTDYINNDYNLTYNSILNNEIQDTLLPDSPNVVTSQTASFWGLDVLAGLAQPHSPKSMGQGVQAVTAGINISRSFSNYQMGLGVELMPYTFSQNEISKRIADSIPHLDPNGDTLGWYQQNERDTLLTGRFESRFSAIQIPLSFYKSWQVRPRFNVLVGGGISANQIREIGYYSTNNQGITEWIPPGSANAKTWIAGYRLECRLEYLLHSNWHILINNRWQGMAPMKDLNANHLVFRAYSFNFGLQYTFK